MNASGGMRLIRELTPADVGRRVMVRRALEDGGFADVLGELVRWEHAQLVVRTADGREVSVPEDAMVAGKRVPPRPTPRRARGSVRHHDTVSDLDIERVAALGWPPLESSRLGDWLLRASDGFTGRGNSVLPLGDPGLALDEAVATVTRWYADRRLPAVFQVPLPAMQDLDEALVARGWSPFHPSVTMTSPLAVVLAATDRATDERLVGRRSPAVEVSEKLDEAWLSAYHYRGGQLPAVARRMLEGGRFRAFATIAGEDLAEAPLAIGRVAVDAGWAGITGMEVSPRARRRGLATAVLNALSAWAADRGAESLYLQVAGENAAARSMYARAGFTEHHHYRYVRAPGSA